MKKKKEPLTVRLPPDVRKWLDSKKDKKGLGYTDVIVRLLVAAMEKDESADDAPRRGNEGFIDISATTAAPARMVAEEKTKYPTRK